MRKNKMKVFECPHCHHKWTMSYWKWILTAPFHKFKFKEWKDYRKTKCPHCQYKGWLKPL